MLANLKGLQALMHLSVPYLQWEGWKSTSPFLSCLTGAKNRKVCPFSAGDEPLVCRGAHSEAHSPQFPQLPCHGPGFVPHGSDELLFFFYLFQDLSQLLLRQGLSSRHTGTQGSGPRGRAMADAGKS